LSYDKMLTMENDNVQQKITTLDELSKFANYSFVESLNSDPESKNSGVDHDPRQVLSGHYVTVNPTPIEDPDYVAHSSSLFNELGLSDELAHDNGFIALFSGDAANVPKPMHTYGWATGYALSIFGTEYFQQCPFQTGNGYGDGRAISVLEVMINNQHWEMQLKGGGRTPYCRGADGRAVLRSSVREFLAQEHMHALGVPTSRSLCLYASKTQKINRPWYSMDSHSKDPDIVVSDPIAISTRVAPSFIRVGQIELFGRRARKQEHPNALKELEMIFLHLIDREYADAIDQALPLEEKLLLLAGEFQERLTSLVANWIRVGYCQGNFNSDNCAAGGFTLDYGPFGFCDEFNPGFQSWTGGGDHFAFFNQPIAAEKNFQMFCKAMEPLLTNQLEVLSRLNKIKGDFSKVMQNKMEKMWASKLGFAHYNDELFRELVALMHHTQVDYTVFFRELSTLPNNIESIKSSFYKQNLSEEGIQIWSNWLKKWRSIASSEDNLNALGAQSLDELTKTMKNINPKYTLREWFLMPAYQQAANQNYKSVRELQAVMTRPYAEQANEISDKHYRLKPAEFFDIGGLSQYSCSS